MFTGHLTDVCIVSLMYSFVKDLHLFWILSLFYDGSVLQVLVADLLKGDITLVTLSLYPTHSYTHPPVANIYITVYSTLHLVFV